MAVGVEISKRILLINSMSTVLRRILSLSVLFWMHQHLIRRIPIEEYALLPVLMSIVAFTPLLSNVLAGGLGRYLTEAYARGDERRVTQITSTMTPMLLGAALLLVGLGYWFGLYIDRFLEIAPAQLESAQQMLLALVCGAALRVAVAPYVLGFYIRQKLVQRDLIGFGVELLRIALLLFLLTQYETRVLWVVVSSVASGVVEVAIVFVLSRRLIPALRFRLSEIRREVIRPVLSFGSWTIVGQVAHVIREMADPLILNRFASAGDVATFHLGATIDRNLRRTVYSATSVVQPAATALAATDQDDRLRRVWFRTSRYSLWIMLGVAAPLILFRDEFFRVYLREQFEANRNASVVMAILLARLVVVFPNEATGLVAHARAAMRPLAVRSLVLEIANLALTLALVGAFSMGSTGAALSTCVVAFVGHPFVLWSLGLRLTGARIGDWLRGAVLPGFVPAFVAVPVWTVSHMALPSHSWLALGIAALPGAVVYAVALWFSLRKEDRADLTSVRQRFLSVFQRS